jgi:hypothetical protein
MRCLFFFHLLLINSISITKQSFYYSDITVLGNTTSLDDTTILDSGVVIPPHCYVLGLPSHSKITFSKKNSVFTLYKPLRKMHEYEYDIERGIKLNRLNGKSNTIDSIAYPDFSTQAVGMAMGGIIATLLFKLFG